MCLFLSHPQSARRAFSNFDLLFSVHWIRLAVYAMRCSMQLLDCVCVLTFIEHKKIRYILCFGRLWSFGSYSAKPKGFAIFVGWWSSFFHLLGICLFMTILLVRLLASRHSKCEHSVLWLRHRITAILQNIRHEQRMSWFMDDRPPLAPSLSQSICVYPFLRRIQLVSLSLSEH